MVYSDQGTGESTSKKKKLYVGTISAVHTHTHQLISAVHHTAEIIHANHI